MKVIINLFAQLLSHRSLQQQVINRFRQKMDTSERLLQVLLEGGGNRCSQYDSGDYRYNQSVELQIIKRMDEHIYGPYTGSYFSNRSEVVIEHIVATSEAHDSGLCKASMYVRKLFAKDLLNLTLASPSENRKKWCYDAAEWLPNENACWFADTVEKVRNKYGLTINRDEADALEKVRSTCQSVEIVFDSGPEIEGDSNN